MSFDTIDMMGFWIILFLFPVLCHASDEGLQAFSHVYRVATHPRCTNCHSSTDIPLVGDNGARHPMNVQRGIEKLGQSCATCHAASVGNRVGLPPAAENWHMPSPAKSFRAKMSPQKLCEKLKDKKINFFESGPRQGEGRSLDDLIEHVQVDTLVRWAWLPREKMTQPVGTHSEFVSEVRRWVAAGAPCPEK